MTHVSLSEGFEKKLKMIWTEVTKDLFEGNKFPRKIFTSLDVSIWHQCTIIFSFLLQILLDFLFRKPFILSWFSVLFYFIFQTSDSQSLLRGLLLSWFFRSSQSQILEKNYFRFIRQKWLETVKIFQIFINYWVFFCNLKVCKFLLHF
jgi:hypothetical protein